MTTNLSDLTQNITIDGQTNIAEYFFVSWYIFEKMLVVLTNSFTVLLLWKYAKLETPSTIFIACLTITDLLSAAGLPSFLGSTYLPRGLGWTLSCISMLFIRMVTSLMSSTILCVIAVDRLLYVHHALQYHTVMTLRRATTAVVAVATFSLVFSTLCMGTGYQNPSDGDSVVGDCIAFMAIKKQVGLVIGIPHYLLIPITVCCYIKIGLIALKQRRAITAVETGHSMMAQTNFRIAKVMLTVFIVYIISNAAKIVQPVLYLYLHGAPRELVFRLCRTILNVTTWINPIIYVWKSKRFRQHVRNFLGNYTGSSSKAPF